MSIRRATQAAFIALTILLTVTGCATQATPRMPLPAVAHDPTPAHVVDEPTPTPEPTVAPTPDVPAAPSSPPAVEPAPTTPDEPAPAILAPGERAEDVRELQHRLHQLAWFEPPITDVYGNDTQAAVEGFQAKRGLPVTGAVDDATWQVLLDMTRQPTHDEMHNIMRPGPTLLAAGDEGDEVRDLQARLRQIGWYSEKIDGVFGTRITEAISGFQAKRGIPSTGEVDRRTLDRLLAMTRTPTTDELNNIFPTAEPDGMRLDERCLTGRVICISKKARQLAWVVDGKVEMRMDVRFGSRREPTREGTFSVQWKSRDHVSSLYDSPMPFALFFSGGQAVHYSSDFAARGYDGASHGCVNVRDRDAVQRLFDTARVGDKVIVYSD